MRTGDNSWPVMGLVALLLVAALALVLIVAGCGSAGDVASPVAREATPTAEPTQPPPAEDLCGDGVCDEVEQKNPSLCPEDCPPPPEPTLAPTPTPTPEPTKDLCGDGICDEEELKQPDLCPQDCAGVPGEPGDDEPAAYDYPSRARLWLMWRSSYGGCPNRQVDDLFAEMEFSLDLTEDGGLRGKGEGTLYADEVSRCPGTEYGGVRTPDPYAVTVTGTVRTITGTTTPTGWLLEVTARDRSEAFFTSGTTYREECILCWVMPQFKGHGISGNATYFGLPRELLPGDSFLFEMNYPVPQAGWTNEHKGEGRIEILEVSQ